MEFKYPLRRAPEAILDRIVTLAQDKVVVSGNGLRGHFTGMFEGMYAVNGSNASITITRKPMFLSWSLVDEGLRHLVA